MGHLRLGGEVALLHPNDRLREDSSGKCTFRRKTRLKRATIDASGIGMTMKARRLFPRRGLDRLQARPDADRPTAPFFELDGDRDAPENLAGMRESARPVPR